MRDFSAESVFNCYTIKNITGSHDYSIFQNFGTETHYGRYKRTASIM